MWDRRKGRIFGVIVTNQITNYFVARRKEGLISVATISRNPISLQIIL